MRKLSIAIDGPSAAGKSTIAKIIAAKKEYVYIDTGAMYRSVAYYCLTHDIALGNKEAVEANVDNIEIRMTPDHKIFVNEEDVTTSIRTDEVSLGASKVSAYPRVREYLVEQQRKMAKAGGVILDGRDIGTVVLPDADLKIYQVASSETRAKRRYKENIERGMDADLAKIQKEIEERDYADMHRAISPLKKAEDAIEIDTSYMTLEEVSAAILKLIEEKEK